MASPKVLVTGGSGYLGVHVRQFFAADDFSRRSSLDILDVTDAAVVADYDVVIHLAAHLDKAPEAAETCFQTNVEGTANILRNTREGAVFIFASTRDVYGSFADQYTDVPEVCSTEYCGQSAYEWSKLVAERYVDYYSRARKLRSCTFRLSATYARPSEGNEVGFITRYVESVKRRWPLRLPLKGAPVRDILHVTDFARACESFIGSGVSHGIYNLGGGRSNSASLREIVDTIAEIIQCAPVFDESLELPPPVPLNYVSDISRFSRHTGWEPRIGMREGLSSLI